MPLVGGGLFAARRLSIYAMKKKSRWLCCSRTGRQSDRSSLGATLRKHCDDLDVRRFSPHVLRHCLASWIASTGHLSTLSNLLGHADISTTQNHYVHLTPQNVAETLAAVRSARRANRGARR